MLNQNKQTSVAYDLYVRTSQSTLKSSLAMLINVVVIVIAFYEINDAIFLFSWLSLVTVLLGLRSYDVYNYFKDENPKTLSVHIKRFKIYSFLVALVVSSGIIFLTPSHLPFHQAFLAMIVAGLSAGAVMALSYYQTLLRLYIMVLVFPFASLMLLQGSTIHILISFLMFLFLVMLMLFSKKLYDSMLELIESKNEASLQAHYDIITGLANRLTLYDRVSGELQRIKMNQVHAAILFIDLDDFKLINDTHGHHFGDTVLKEFAKLISSVVRVEDTFARLSGDEFVILVSNIRGDKQKAVRIAQQIADKVHTMLESPLTIKAQEILIKVSIGIDIIDEDTQDLDHVLNNADAAMYKSKKSGKSQTTLFK